MALHELAGKPALNSMLANIPRLVSSYYSFKPDPADPGHQVAFGTSGHRGTPLKNSFNENHVLAITQAICEFRRAKAIEGPLFLGMDSHALSEPSFITALEVLAANDVRTVIQSGQGYTPTPVISHAILVHNRKNKSTRADGIVITPSHNPPEDGGFKYNPPEGGPADTDTTRWIEQRANAILQDGLKSVRRMTYAEALRAQTTDHYDYIEPYVDDLRNIIDMEIIRSRGIRIGVDPMGGSTLPFWKPIATKYGLNIDVVNPAVDPTFRFMALDWDGKIRMDCSSPYAMAGLIDLKDAYDIAFGNDPDGDRHGIVSPSRGLMNPNAFLALSIWYLFGNRPDWPEHFAIGKTLVSSSMIDRVAKLLGRRVAHVPVGFKWFVPGLLEGVFGFAGEESAGASFVRKDGTVWTTDKDGIIMDLLAAEITAKLRKDPSQLYEELTRMLGRPVYERIDVPTNLREKALLSAMSTDQIRRDTLAGEKILEKLTHAPENQAPIGGIKISSKNGWFAARPSGTEDIYKVYAESFIGKDHLKQIQQEARDMIAEVLRSKTG